MRLGLAVFCAFVAMATSVSAGSYSGRMLGDIPGGTAQIDCDIIVQPPWCRLGYEGGDAIHVRLAEGEAGRAYTAALASPSHAEAKLCWTDAPAIFRPAQHTQCMFLTNGDQTDAFLCGCDVGAEGVVPEWATAFEMEVVFGVDVAWTIDIA